MLLKFMREGARTFFGLIVIFQGYVCIHQTHFSKCNFEASPFFRWAIAVSSIIFTSPVFGLVNIVQLIINLSKQSTIGNKYIFPAGRANSVLAILYMALFVCSYQMT